METLLLLLLIKSAPGQWAQVDPKVQQWFQDQEVPGSSVKCCSAADGFTAEEDIRGGYYWARWEVGGEATPWIKVPTEAILPTSNPNGTPVVWWGTQMELGGAPEFIVRCYAPGAKS